MFIICMAQPDGDVHVRVAGHCNTARTGKPGQVAADFMIHTCMEAGQAGFLPIGSMRAGQRHRTGRGNTAEKAASLDIQAIFCKPCVRQQPFAIISELYKFFLHVLFCQVIIAQLSVIACLLELIADPAGNGHRRGKSYRRKRHACIRYQPRLIAGIGYAPGGDGDAAVIWQLNLTARQGLPHGSHRR